MYGVGIGDSLDSVVSVNGIDFDFYGFEWSRAGEVVNWNNGLLHQKIGVKFKIISEYNNYVIDNLIGDHVLNSYNIDGEKVQIVVDEIIIKLN